MEHSERVLFFFFDKRERDKQINEKSIEHIDKC